MTIITVSVGCNERTDTYTGRNHCNGVVTEYCGETHIEEIDWDTIKFNIETCNYDCKCRDSNSYNVCKNVGSLSTIEKLMTKSNYCRYSDDDDDDYKINYVLKKISLLIKNNKYAQIQEVLDDEFTRPHDQYCSIRNIINDDTSYSEPDISFEENSDSNSENNDEDTITSVYPFAVNFTELNGMYTAKIHIKDYSISLNEIYITIKNDTDAFGCCSRGSYEHEKPIQLTIARPIKGDDNFSDYDKFTGYRKNRDNYVYNSQLSY